MNRRTAVITAVLIVVVIGGALLVGLSAGKTAADGCKPGTKIVAYHVTIQSGKAAPVNIAGHRCDTLTITNEDEVAREIAFGPHENHIPYDGVAERVLNKGQSLTVTLNQTGSFHWHDHLHDEVEGFFTVTK